MSDAVHQRLDVEAPVVAPTVELGALSVLVVEDSISDQRLILETLVDAGADRARVSCVATLRDARQSLIERPVSCVLLDLSLPDASGLESVTLLSAAAPDTPVVIVTGQAAGPMVHAAMAEGADEYVCKADLDPQLLGDVVARAIQRRRGSIRHRQMLASAAAVFDSISSPIAVIDGSGRIVAVNGAWERTGVLSGADPTRIGIGVNYLAVCDHAAGRFAEGADAIAQGIRGVLSGDLDSFTMDYPCPTPDEERWFSLRVNPSGEMGGGAVLIHLDVSDLKAAERGALARDSRIFGALDTTSPIFALIGPDAAVLHVSELTCSLLGLTAGERIGEDAFSLIEPTDRVLAMDVFARVSAVPGTEEQVTIRALDGEGRWRALDLSVVNLLDDPRVGAIAVTGSDVTDTRLHQIARRLESRLLARLPVAIGLTDDSGILVYWNDRAEALFGISGSEALGRSTADLGLETTDQNVTEDIQRTLAEGKPWEGDLDAPRADGSIVPLHVVVERIDDDEIDFHGTVYASFDNTERDRLERELEFQAFHDPLTALPNRRLFVERLDAALAEHEAGGRLAAVTFIDLDDFKALNDRVGHTAGDLALQIIADRLRSVLRPGDLVARIGGDEFVVGFADLQGPEGAVAIAERVLRAVRAPFRIGHHSLHLSATIGVAMSQPGVPADGLLRNADAAMYEAKGNGKDTVWLFDDALQQRNRDRREQADDLLRSLVAGEIHAHLQPQFCLHTGDLVGFEALARREGEDGQISESADFIELAEESGVIDQIDQQVLAEACDALAVLHAEHADATPTIAVNVSATQIGDPGFPAMVRQLVEDAGFPPHLLCIEVVESALADEHAAAATLEEIKQIGVELAIDDFGTGYSSLSRLQRFAVDYLKIDRGFVAGMGDAGDDAAVVSAVIGLGHALGLRTVAEGVEDEAQRERLCQLGVDIGQGFLWSPAVSVADALELVRNAGSTGTPCWAPVD
ncbi:EAL domain-containing protein [Acidimicrobiia bacterium EGI L10123]|uniref:sensor domain-containing protein n=1 Tax=Salinilacustrithrix flava TaxID=2957203 RepID=UPI003D7C1F2B|nr:EAL domain-containing protein [Acidimicrobiia bacterium EGI L10123]